MIILLIAWLGSMLFLAHLESPKAQYESAINAFVRESRKKERAPKVNRAFKYAQVGWRGEP